MHRPAGDALLHQLFQEAIALSRKRHVAMLLAPFTKAVLTQTRMTLSLPPLNRRLPALCSVKTLPLCPRSTLHPQYDALRWLFQSLACMFALAMTPLCQSQQGRLVAG